MSRKNVLAPYLIITNGTMSGTNTINSTSTNISRLDNVGIGIEWTGTPTGTFTVSTSMDNGVNSAWIPLTFNPALTAPSGSAGNFSINLTEIPFPFIRVSYTNSSGTGTLNVWITGKDVN